MGAISKGKGRISFRPGHLFLGGVGQGNSKVFIMEIASSSFGGWRGLTQQITLLVLDQKIPE